MLFLISGRDGSTGYSFFSDAQEIGRSFNFTFIGEGGESESEDEDPFSGEDESGDEFEFEVTVEMLRFRSTEEPLVARSSSRVALTS